MIVSGLVGTVRVFRFDARHLDAARHQPNGIVTFRPGVYWRVIEAANNSGAPNGIDLTLDPVDGHDIAATADVYELPLPVREVLFA